MLNRLTHCGTALIILLGGLSAPAKANLVENGGFEAYTNASAASDTAVINGQPVSWIETGNGGHTFIGDQFGDYVANGVTYGETDADPQVPYTAWLTEFDEGIFQSFATVSGETYRVDLLLGQFAPEILPTLQATAFDGAGTAGLVLDAWSLVVDADTWGDGQVTSAFVWDFTATGETSTILFTLGANDSSKQEGLGLDRVLVTVVPEPGTATIAALAGMTILIGPRRRRPQEL